MGTTTTRTKLLAALCVALACTSCAAALVGVCVGVSAAGVTAAVVVENNRETPKDAGTDASLLK